MPIPNTLLIVDDDFDDREMLIETLLELNPNIKCCEAANGYEGLEKLHHCQSVPDMIFLDLNMPKMNGRQFLEQIKSITSLAQIPVIIYSTSKQIEDKEETARLGAAFFLTKPVTTEELKHELLNVFSTLAQNTLSIH